MDIQGRSAIRFSCILRNHLAHRLQCEIPLSYFERCVSLIVGRWHHQNQTQGLGHGNRKEQGYRAYWSRTIPAIKFHRNYSTDDSIRTLFHHGQVSTDTERGKQDKTASIYKTRDDRKDVKIRHGVLKQHARRNRQQHQLQEFLLVGDWNLPRRNEPSSMELSKELINRNAVAIKRDLEENNQSIQSLASWLRAFADAFYEYANEHNIPASLRTYASAKVVESWVDVMVARIMASDFDENISTLDWVIVLKKIRYLKVRLSHSQWDAIVHLVMTHLEKHRESSPAWYVVDIMAALCKIRPDNHTQNSKLFELWEDIILEDMDRLSCSRISQVIWIAGSWNTMLKDETMNTCLARFVASPAKFNELDISSSLWAFARLAYKLPAHVQLAIDQRVQEILPSSIGRVGPVVIICWSAVELDLVFSDSVAVLLEAHCHKQYHKYDAHHLGLALQALVKMNKPISLQTLELAEACLMTSLNSGEELIHVARLLQVMKASEYCPSDSALDLYEHAVKLAFAIESKDVATASGYQWGMIDALTNLLNFRRKLDDETFDAFQKYAESYMDHLTVSDFCNIIYIISVLDRELRPEVYASWERQFPHIIKIAPMGFLVRVVRNIANSRLSISQESFREWDRMLTENMNHIDPADAIHAWSYSKKLNHKHSLHAFSAWSRIVTPQALSQVSARVAFQVLIDLDAHGFPVGSLLRETFVHSIWTRQHELSKTLRDFFNNMYPSAI